MLKGELLMKIENNNRVVLEIVNDSHRNREAVRYIGNLKKNKLGVNGPFSVEEKNPKYRINICLRSFKDQMVL